MTYKFFNIWTRLAWFYFVHNPDRLEEVIEDIKPIDKYAIGTITRIIQEHFESRNPHADDFGYSIWSDFIGTALSYVNFYQIAELIMDPEKRPVLEDS